jgi:hypothetical protein
LAIEASSFRAGYATIIEAASVNPERINPVKALRLLLCLGLAACADLETKPWFRADGGPASPEQLEVDKSACREEMQKSVRATAQAASLDRGLVRADVYDGCMARLGYTESATQRFTPPPSAQAGTAPPGGQGASTPPIAQGAPPPPSDQQCRKPADLRIWLPLCP